MSASFTPDFGSEFASLTPEQQEQVVEFARQFKSDTTEHQRRQAIIDLAGSIPADDIKRMKAAIEAGCEQVDPDGW